MASQGGNHYFKISGENVRWPASTHGKVGRRVCENERCKFLDQFFIRARMFLSAGKRASFLMSCTPERLRTSTRTECPLLASAASIYDQFRLIPSGHDVPMDGRQVSTPLVLDRLHPV